MPGTVILHVGKHKTGSTSIQRYLDDNQAFFEANGIGVFTEDRRENKRAARSNLFEISNLIIRDSLATPVRIKGAVKVLNRLEKQAAVASFQKRLQAMPYDKVLMSGESFSFLRTVEEKAALGELLQGMRVIPIVFLREHRSWLASWEKQMAGHLKLVDESEKGAGTIFDFSDDSWLVDDQAIIDFFGSELLRFSYENATQGNNSVVDAFLSAIGLGTGSIPSTDEYWYNLRG